MTFGKSILVTLHLKRVRKNDFKYWEPYPIKPVKCIIIGVRTLSDGYVMGFPEPWNNDYVEQGRYQVYLVAVKDNLSINPFYTPIL